MADINERPDTVECLRCIGFALGIAALAMAILWLFAQPAQAQMPEGVESHEVGIDCGESLCVLPKDDLFAIMSANKRMAKALAEKAKEGPKCGSLEVVPKAPPPVVKPDPKTLRDS